MGKVDFQSHQVQLPVSIEDAFAFLRDLNNLKELMPEQVINWKSTEETCSFDIKGMAHITLQRAETIPPQLVRIVSAEDTPLELEIMGKLEKANDHQTSARIELSAELSPMLKMMVSGPLQNLVNIMADRLVTAFKSQT
jgi:carbon monoxide dehydrogenase subunit G